MNTKIIIGIAVIAIIIIIAIIVLRKKNDKEGWSQQNVSDGKEMLKMKLLNDLDPSISDSIIAKIIDDIQRDTSYSSFKTMILDKNFPSTKDGVQFIAFIESEFDKYKIVAGKPGKWSPFMEMVVVTALCKEDSTIGTKQGKCIVGTISKSTSFFSFWVDYIKGKKQRPIDSYKESCPLTNDDTPFIKIIS
jgi:hypothetical protein